MDSFLKKFRRDRSSPREKTSNDNHLQKVPAVTGNNTTSGAKGNLVLLSSPPENSEAGKKSFCVNIVAIHGLGGDAIDTWKHADGTVWLRDVLPNALPGARVFSYGYPSEIFFSRSAAGIRQFSLHLLNRLESALAEDTQTRPIIYICHSLGGIVLKQAMILAPVHFPQLWRRSKGVVFFGTPHRGSFSAKPARVLGDIFNVVWSVGALSMTAARTSLLRDLQENSTALSAIADDFTARAGELGIATYYETVITAGPGKVIVEQASAVIGLAHEKRIPMYRNHREICKFGQGDADDLRDVMFRLKNMLEETTTDTTVDDTASSVQTDGSFDAFEKDCVRLLNIIDVPGHVSLLGLPAKGTLQWIFKNACYNTWITEQQTRLICVTGYPGCGKTMLSSYISNQLGASSDVLMCRFFFDGKIPEQRKASSLLRSLIHQMIIARRALIKLVKRAFEVQGVKLFDRFEALWDLFVDILRQFDGKVSIVIDAVDECERVSQGLITRGISRLLSSNIVPSVKFFLTCRTDTPIFYVLGEEFLTSKSCVSLDLEKEQRIICEDIDMFVDQRLNRLVSTGLVKRRALSQLKEQLVARAERTFLWVSIILDLLENGDRMFLSSSELFGFIERIPDQLTATYESFLASVHPDNRKSAGGILRHIAVSARPLTIDELRVSYVIRPCHQSLQALEIDTAEFSFPLVQRLLGPLIRISDSKVYLVHTTLRDYLIHLNDTPEEPLAIDFGVNLSRDHLKIAQSCMLYLSLEDFNRGMFATDSDESSLRSLSTIASCEAFRLSDEFLAFPDLFKEQSPYDMDRCDMLAARHVFFDYAAKHWAFQFERSNPFADTNLHELAVSTCDTGSAIFHNWFRYHWLHEALGKRVSLECYPIMTGTIAVAGFFGFRATLKHALDRSGCEMAELGAAVYWAAQRGHVLSLRILLDFGPIDPGTCHVDKQSPLSAAAEHGHLECVRPLLETAYFDVNEQNSDGMTPLALAACGGYTAIVSLLLSHPKHVTDVNLADKGGSSPLIWAASTNSSHAIVKLLSNDRIQPNQVDHRGRSALLWAAIESHNEAARALINDPRVEIEAKDSDGRTPLIYASKAGNDTLVTLLLKSKRTNALSRDRNGRHSISWAAGQSREKVLRILLVCEQKTAAKLVDAEDVDGWTPLAWTLDAPGYPKNASLLLQSGFVNVNHKDQSGLSLLSLAVAYRQLGIVMMLARAKGINLNSTSKAGRTPLSYAAGKGAEDMVDFLLGLEGIETDHKDNVGRTPLCWAAMGGHVYVVKLLLRVKCANPTLDEEDRSALFLAVENGHQEVASLIKKSRMQSVD